MNNFIDLSATEMSEGIKSGVFISEQLIQAQLNQIGQHNSTINAIVTHSSDALERAKKADEALLGIAAWVCPSR